MLCSTHFFTQLAAVCLWVNCGPTLCLVSMHGVMNWAVGLQLPRSPSCPNLQKETCGLWRNLHLHSHGLQWAERLPNTTWSWHHPRAQGAEAEFQVSLGYMTLPNLGAPGSGWMEATDLAEPRLP